MPELTRIYSLREDREHIAAIQRATLQTTDFGLVPDPWLFGSPEWWEAVATGDIPTHTVTGTISGVFMSGHNDYPEFEVDDGATKTQWTRQTSQIAESDLSREQMAQLYRVGAGVRLDYVLQCFKKPLPGLGPHSKCVLGVWVEHVA